MAIFSNKTEDKKKEATAPAQVGAEVRIPSVLIQPRISEKAGHLTSLNKYVFKVKPSANKIEVKKAVESFYKVKVVQVNMVRNQGKNRNFGRTAGRTSDFKKAIITLKKGDKIEGLTDVI
jgi:large subunit ribosomal protein L23